MLMAVIPVRDYHTARQQIQAASRLADGVELRLDYMSPLDHAAITALRTGFPLPMVFTLRKASEGGHYQGTEAERLQTILALCKAGPDYLDLEQDVAPSFLKEIRQRYPQIRIIRSLHDFERTPQDLMTLLESLQNPPVYAYKISTFAHTTQDALRMLQFVYTLRGKHRVTGLCMGEQGQCTRILSPLIGNLMCYASLENSEAVVQGQLSLDILLTTYRFRQSNPHTKIYALLGDPVEESVGHILHNQAMTQLGENAVYIKLKATPAELPAVLQTCRSLPFAGFSVTMPLKEAIVPWLDITECSPVQAVNTVICQQGKMHGFNTDGMGALKALPKQWDLSRQTIVILGAGGAARAIVHEARQHGANVIVLNRTVDKANALAKETGCDSGPLSHLSGLTGYTLIINTLPVRAWTDTHLLQWIHPEVILPQAMAMDIVYQPRLTPFLAMAEKAGCVCLPGSGMYIQQALLQIKRWFGATDESLRPVRQSMEAWFEICP